MHTNSAISMASANGTFETCKLIPRMSVNRGRPEVSGALSIRRDWPEADVWGDPPPHQCHHAQIHNSQQAERERATHSFPAVALQRANNLTQGPLQWAPGSEPEPVTGKHSDRIQK